MNKENGGRCYVNEGWHNVYYNIVADENGNSPLTGEGHQQEGWFKEFTCEEVEVYQVFY